MDSSPWCLRSLTALVDRGLRKAGNEVCVQRRTAKRKICGEDRSLRSVVNVSEPPSYSSSVLASPFAPAEYLTAQVEQTAAVTIPQSPFVAFHASYSRLPSTHG